MSLLRTLKFVTEHPLNREHKLRALARFAKWQVRSRLARDAVVHDWVDGAKFLVRAGEHGLTGNIYTGLHEFADMGFLLHVLRPEDLFVDVGANVGSYTLLACAALRARGVAFEPIPSTYERLAQNLRLNGLEGRVTSVNLGVGAEQGSVLFTGDGDTMNHALAAGEQRTGSILVEMTTLDLFLAGRSPSVIKVDVEGHEQAVLEGASETLRDPALHSVIMELNGSAHRYGYAEARILELMFDSGFGSYSYDPLQRDLVRLTGKNEHSGNTLFVRDEALVRERLRTAPPVSVNGRQF